MARGVIWRMIRSGSSGWSTLWVRSPPAAVEIRPTPTTRSPNSSGSCSASAMTVIPPMEWPTSTTGPSGTSSSSTVFRSRPSCSIVAWCFVERPERPCERWS